MSRAAALVIVDTWPGAGEVRRMAAMMKVVAESQDGYAAILTAALRQYEP